jgi:hypothetical protein
VGKNLYQWHGTTHWIATLAGLRQLAIKFNMLERYNEVKHLEESDPGYGSYSVSPPMGGGTPKGVSPFTPTYSPCSSSSGPSPSPAERKTSLGFACQKFLMLFLIAPEVKKRFKKGHWLPCTLALSKTSLLLVKLTSFCLMERKKKFHVLFSCSKATFY